MGFFLAKNVGANPENHTPSPRITQCAHLEHYRTPQIWSELAAISTGTNQRRRRLQPSAFLDYQMPVPPMSSQKKLREIVQRRTETNAKHAETRKSLKALLPSMLEQIFRSAE
jgi:type I restriction enzyme S subunit